MSSIFSPLIKAPPKSNVLIATWNVAEHFSMREVVVPLSRSKVGLLVGYSKKTHDLRELIGILKFYKYDLGWDVRMVPNLHIKAWIINETAYVGSCNFVPNEPIINEMWKVPFSKVFPVVSHYFKGAAQLSHSTVLQLVHPVDRHA